MRSYHPIAQRLGDKFLLAVPGELQRHTLVANLDTQNMSTIVFEGRLRRGRMFYPIAYPVYVASKHQYIYISLKQLFDVEMRGK
jgi:hypothetical protein